MFSHAQSLGIGSSLKNLEILPQGIHFCRENVSEPSVKRLRIEIIELVTSKVHENESVRMKVFISTLRLRIQTSDQPK